MSDIQVSGASRVIRLTVWALLLALALATLYLLSVPPLIRYVTHNAASRTALPAWLQTYRAPYDRLSAHPPFMVPLDRYLAWWNVAGGGGYVVIYGQVTHQGRYE